MYDTLEDTQVKLFFKPVLDVSYDFINGKSDVLQCNLIGGDLHYYRRGSVLPVKTSYYDYGKNFMIYDFTCENLNEVKVQIIHNGLFVRNVSYKDIDKIPLRYKLGLVVDKNGVALKINTLNDFKSLKKDYDEWYSRYFYELEHDPVLNSFSRKLNSVREFQKLNCVKNLTVSEKDLISLSEFEEWQSEVYEPRLKVVHGIYIGRFNQKWVHSSKSSYYSEINGGLIIGSYMETINRYIDLEDNLDYSVLVGQLPYSILCYNITNAFLSYYTLRNESMNDIIDNYYDWCSRHQINGYIRKDIINYLNKYGKELPENLKELEKEYNRRRDASVSTNR